MTLEPDGKTAKNRVRRQTARNHQSVLGGDGNAVIILGTEVDVGRKKSPGGRFLDRCGVLSVASSPDGPRREAFVDDDAQLLFGVVNRRSERGGEVLKVWPTGRITVLEIGTETVFPPCPVWLPYLGQLLSSLLLLRPTHFAKIFIYIDL